LAFDRASLAVFVPVQRHEYLVHEDLALIIEGLLQVSDAQGMLDIVVSANAMDFHADTPW
jgi:hypothetical protein